MTRRRKILLCVLCGVIAVGAVCFFCLRESEPSYNGRTLSEWLERYHNAPFHPANMMSEITEAINAVRAIGQDAIPFLVSWNNAQNSPTIERLQEGFKELPDELQLERIQKWFRLADAGVRHELALDGFQILGTNAAAVLPDLERTFNAATNLSDAVRYANVIQSLGVGARDFFVQVARKGGTNVQVMLAIDALGHMRYLGTNIAPAVPLLLEFMENTNAPDSSRAAAVSLAGLNYYPEKVLPVLTNMLESTNRAERYRGFYGLSFVGQMVGVPSGPLKSALTDPDPLIRRAATNTVQKIAPELLTNKLSSNN